MSRRMSWVHYVLEGGAYGVQVSLIEHRKEKTRGRLLTGIPPGLRCAYGRLRISYADDVARMARVKPWISTLRAGCICQPRTLPTSKVSAGIPQGSYCPSKTNFRSSHWRSRVSPSAGPIFVRRNSKACSSERRQITPRTHSPPAN